MPNSVLVTGGKAWQKELAENIVHWCCKELLPRYRSLDLVIELKDLKGAAYGYCMNISYESKNPREFEIEIDKNLSLFDFFSTLCHEMIHVKQYIKKELWYDNFGNCRWKTGRVGDNVQYRNRPYEKEAFKREKALALKCFEELT